jgi:DNA transformation protein
MSVSSAFADFCCELLASMGSLRVRRMFGGWGLSIEGLTVAIVADLGQGDRLWLKADAQTRAVFEAAGCARFTYPMRQGDSVVDRSMNYYCPPDDAMDAPDAMAPWARLALDSALKARANRPSPAPRPRKAGPRTKAAPRSRPVKRAPAAATRRHPQG